MKQFVFLTKKYLKMLYNSKESTFWTVIFPLILVTLYYFAFNNLRVPQNEPIRIGVETGSPYEQVLQQIDIVDVSSGSSEAQMPALRADTIDAFLTSDGTLHVVKDGLRQGIAKEITDQILQAGKLGPSARFLQYRDSWITTDQIDTDPMVVQFYSLLVMATLYTAFQGITISLLLQANLSQIALRNNMVPTPKSALLGSFAVGGLILNLLANALMLFATEVIFNYNLIRNWPGSIGLILLGNVFGLSLGLLIGTSNRRPQYVKILISNAVIMSMAMLGGMMGAELKNLIEDRLYWLSRINPIGLLSEQLIQTNVLKQTESILPLVAYIAALCAVNFTIATFFLKKRQYKSL